MKGYVYVLSNEAMPGVYKIGRSEHGGTARAKQLWTTGLPSPFVVEFEVFCQNAEETEIAVHECLEESRVDARREFFKADLEEIIEAVACEALSSFNLSVCYAELAVDPSNLAILARHAGCHPFQVGDLLRFIDPSAISDAYQTLRNRVYGRLPKGDK